MFSKLTAWSATKNVIHCQNRMHMYSVQTIQIKRFCQTPRRKESINAPDIWSSHHSQIPPKTIAFPSRYIQGNGVIKSIGNYLEILSTNKCAVMVGPKTKSIVIDDVNESLHTNNIDSIVLDFEGECSYEEVERLYQICTKETVPIDTLITLGGGKAIDAGKLLSHYLDSYFVSFPTVASTDAPASSVSIMYTKDHQFADAYNFPRNPDMVLVDTGIISKSPVRYFVAGVGDALATYYEARACYNNNNAYNFDGGRIALCLLNWAQLSSEILFEYAIDATNAVKNGTVNDALDKCLESTILLSGIGFQSGGLAAAHSIATALSNNAYIHDNYMHGEHVAVGLVAELILENDIDEAMKVAKLCNDIGLPWNCNGLNYDICDDKLDEILDCAMGLWVSSHAFPISKEMIFDALRKANELQNQVE